MICPGETGYECSGRMRGGFCSRCYDRRWRRANPEKVAAAMRRYRETHRAKMAEVQQRYFWAHRERMREKDRRYYQATRIKHAARRREATRRYSARKRDALTIPFTHAELAQRMAFWGNRCWMCGGEYQEVDHVISLVSGGPHCLSNLRPACRSCNASKGANDWRSLRVA